MVLLHLYIDSSLLNDISLKKTFNVYRILIPLRGRVLLQKNEAVYHDPLCAYYICTTILLETVEFQNKLLYLLAYYSKTEL